MAHKLVKFAGLASCRGQLQCCEAELRSSKQHEAELEAHISEVAFTILQCNLLVSSFCLPKLISKSLFQQMQYIAKIGELFILITALSLICPSAVFAS